MKSKVIYLKEIFDKFLKDNNAYDAWYERYRLDNLMYGDEVPVDEFFNTMIIHGEECVNSLFYNGVSATCLLNKNAEIFIEENKQCDILSNETIADLDSKWMDSWKTLVDVKLLW